MQKVRVAGFGVSLDGFSAGIEQSLSDPLGKRGTEIFQWYFRAKTFRAMLGQEGGVVDTDDEFARKAMDNFGAFILGRNMFGPVRGPWLDRSWKGWWGENPPYHTPTFVLTHYEHEPLVMEGGTTFCRARYALWTWAAGIPASTGIQLMPQTHLRARMTGIPRRMQ